MIRDPLATLSLVIAFAGCPAASAPVTPAAPPAADPRGGVEDELDVSFAVGRPCDHDSECPEPLKCVEDCANGAVVGVSQVIAQLGGCPSVCGYEAGDTVAQHVRSSDEDDEGKNKGEDEDDEDAVSAPVASRPVVSTPSPSLPSASEPGTGGGLMIAPVEETKAGDGKLLEAFGHVIAMMGELNGAVAAASGCEARVRAVETWSAANGARSSRLSYRVQHLSERRNHDWDAAEKAAGRRQEATYERLGELLTEVCAEDGPEMARLGELDVDLRHSFHRVPQQDEYLKDRRCAIMREIRDRALLAPTTLIGERQPDGSHRTSLEPDGFVCFINGDEWTSGKGKELTVACVDFARPKERYADFGHGKMDLWKGRHDHLSLLVGTCFSDTRSDFGYKGDDKDLTEVRRESTQGEWHLVRGRASTLPAHEGSYLWSLHRRR